MDLTIYIHDVCLLCYRYDMPFDCKYVYFKFLQDLGRKRRRSRRRRSSRRRRGPAAARDGGQEA
jgi:hypothetical protein